MRSLKVSFLALIACTLASSALAKPVSTGGGKYSRCKTSYDKCMGDVVGSPGDQIYNVGKAKCYKAWKSCVGMGTVALGTGSPAGDIAAIQEFETVFQLETKAKAAAHADSNDGDENGTDEQAPEASEGSVWE